MAFSKIVGLEVTPRKPSSSMSFLSSPESRIALEILSSQTLCPKPCSSTNAFACLVSVRFDVITLSKIELHDCTAVSFFSRCFCSLSRSVRFRVFDPLAAYVGRFQGSAQLASCEECRRQEPTRRHAHPSRAH